MTYAHDLTDRAPQWTINATAIELPLSDWGFECHRLDRDGATIGWAYDAGNGYEFTDSKPEPDESSPYYKRPA